MTLASFSTLYIHRTVWLPSEIMTMQCLSIQSPSSCYWWKQQQMYSVKFTQIFYYNSNINSNDRWRQFGGNLYTNGSVKDTSEQRRTDRETHREIYEQTDRHTDRETHREIYEQTDGHRDSHAEVWCDDVTVTPRGMLPCQNSPPDLHRSTSHISK